LRKSVLPSPTFASLASASSTKKARLTRRAGSDQAPDTSLLRFFRNEEEHTLRVDFNTPLSRSQSATLVVEYAGILNSADNSPLEGVQIARIHEDVSYLFALSRWFPMHRFLKDRATGTFRITVPQGVVVAMDGTAKPKEQKATRMSIPS
jgi:hypothetical protein